MEAQLNTAILDNIVRILLIRRDNVGDLICTTPAIAALRRHYPNAQIGALVNTYNAQVLDGNPHLNKVFVYQKIKHAAGFFPKIKSLCSRVRLIIELRRWAPDFVILAKSGYDRHGLDFARRIGAKRIIGFLPGAAERSMRLPETSVALPNFMGLHEVEVINKLLGPLDIDDALGSLEVFPDARAVAILEDRILREKQNVAIHLSAREKERRWGQENYVALINSLLKTIPNVQIILLWSPGEADNPYHPGDDAIACQIVAAIDDERIRPIQTKKIMELAAAISLSDLFVGIDGGAMHLAAALNKKTVALFENSDAKLAHWYPWKVPSKVVYSEDKNKPEVRHISVEQVTRAISEFIQ